MFVLAYRPAREPGGGLGLGRLPGFSELVLDRMADVEVGEIVRVKLGQLLGEGVDASTALWISSLPAPRAIRSMSRSSCTYIAGQGIDTADPARARDGPAPPTASRASC